MQPLIAADDFADHWYDFVTDRYDIEADELHSPYVPLEPVEVSRDDWQEVMSPVPDAYHGNQVLAAPAGLYDAGDGVDVDRLAADMEGAVAYALADNPEAAPDPVAAFFDAE